MWYPVLMIVTVLTPFGAQPPEHVDLDALNMGGADTEARCEYAVTYAAAKMATDEYDLAPASIDVVCKHREEA